MNVHLFGAVSSPGVSNFGLKATAEKGREIHGQDAANFLEKEFYVDDGLTSFDTPDNAIAIIKKTQAMCAESHLDFTNLPVIAKKYYEPFLQKIAQRH